MPKILYVSLLPLVGSLLILFLQYKIVPQFVRIFADFGLELPAMTQWFITACSPDGPVEYLTGLMFLAAASVGLYGTLRYAGLLRGGLPGTGWLTRRLDRAAVLDALALAVEARQPLTAAVSGLAQTYPSGAIRRRLGRVAADLESGRDWCKSLWGRGLLSSSDLAVLEAAARTDNLPWAMREMADSNRRRFVYRTHALVQVLFPPIILAFGVVVLVVACTMMLPLALLIHNLSR